MTGTCGRHNMTSQKAHIVWTGDDFFQPFGAVPSSRLRTFVPYSEQRLYQRATVLQGGRNVYL